MFDWLQLNTLNKEDMEESEENINKMLIDKEGFIVSEKLTQLQEHSDVVQDILSRPPSRIIKFGMTVFLSVFLLMLVSSNFITYPEMATGEIFVNLVADSAKSYSPKPLLVTFKMLCSAKISNGDSINIKLDQFPYQVYGTLKGIIVSESYNKA